MYVRRSLSTRLAAATVATATIVSGMVVGAATSAQAAGRGETPFAYQGSAYGTRVLAGTDQGSAGSGPTAWSVMGCTKAAPVRHTEHGVVGTLNANEMIDVGAVTSATSSYRAKAKALYGSRSVNTVADIVLGDPNGPRLEIGALKTIAKAYSRAGRLGSDTKVAWTDVELHLAPSDQPGTGTPLDDLVDAVNSGADAAALEIIEKAGAIEIPQVGTVSFGWERTPVRERRGFAAASAYALKVELANGSTVNLSRAWSKIFTEVPAGVFSGNAYATEASVLGDGISIGRMAMQPLPCQGTGGKWQRNDVTGIDIPGLLRIGKVDSGTMGLQREVGTARAGTYSYLSSVELGDGALTLQGITGRANVRQNRDGRIVAKHINGTGIASMTVNGEEQVVPTPGNPFISDDFKVEVGLKIPTVRGIKVTAVRISLLDGSGTVLDLGNAKAKIERR